jgi:hypothetical protein
MGNITWETEKMGKYYSNIQGLAPSIETEQAFYPRTEAEYSFQNSVLNKKGAMDKVQKVNNCNIQMHSMWHSMCPCGIPSLLR